MFDNFCTAKPPKNHHKSFKEIWHQSKLLMFFKIHVQVFNKIVSKLIFVILANISQVMWTFDNAFTPKVPKNVTGLLNVHGIG